MVNKEETGEIMFISSFGLLDQSRPHPLEEVVMYNEKTVVWIIEQLDNPVPRYITVLDGLTQFSFTPDHTKAIHFVKEDDAERILRLLRRMGYGSLIASEHIYE